MKRDPVTSTPPIPPELAGEIAAAQTLISYLLMQRMGADPDRVSAFIQWEKKVRAELAVLQTKAKHAIERDKPEAAAVAGVGQ